MPLSVFVFSFLSSVVGLLSSQLSESVMEAILAPFETLTFRAMVDLRGICSFG
jgi:hypothetical protein